VAGVLAAGRADAGAFLARLTRLDPSSLVRLRPLDDSRVALWARLPWDVLVTRTVLGSPEADVTVLAADLLAALDGDGPLPARRDEQWRWPLPPAKVEVLERIPAGTVREIAAAAGQTLRSVAGGGIGGRPVGDRAVRDALLDHVAIKIFSEYADEQIDVPMRLVQALIRMGFLGATTDDAVRVLRAGRWIGLAAAYGSGWLRPASAFSVRPAP
jgi:hypothetical protein